MKKQVVIIGGGASGLAAGIQAAREGASVIILEHTGRVGKKLLSTGNGRCNLTNLAMPEDAYRSSNPGYAKKVIRQFPVSDTLHFFTELGILYTNRDGYIYPRSGQASSILDVLGSELENLNVRIICDCEVIDISPQETTGFLLKTSAGTYTGDAVILAAGSKAAPGTGSDGSGYKLAKRLGHNLIKPLPALVQLRCREKHYKQLAGVRTEVRLELFADGESVARDFGELQLTDYGISGIPVFQISRYASEALDQGRQVKVRIDFLPEIDQNEINSLLESRRLRLGYRSADEFLVGILNKKLAAVLLKLAGIEVSQKSDCITSLQIKSLLRLLKAYETSVSAVNPFSNAQVCSGGIDTREVDPYTMQSRLVKGFYFAGEILDVDGICGGYNLQWAWSTGIIAGRNAGKNRHSDPNG